MENILKPWGQFCDNVPTGVTASSMQFLFLSLFFQLNNGQADMQYESVRD